jgi:anti-sigma B factor antagonist
VNPVPFSVESETPREGVQVLAVKGELDLNTAPQVDQELHPILAGGDSLVVDLSDCEFIDSTGVALLVTAWQSLGDGSGPRQFIVCCPNRQVQRLFEITGLGDQMAITSSLDGAISAAAAEAATEAG